MIAKQLAEGAEGVDFPFPCPVLKDEYARLKSEQISPLTLISSRRRCDAKIDAKEIAFGSPGLHKLH